MARFNIGWFLGGPSWRGCRVCWACAGWLASREGWEGTWCDCSRWFPRLARQTSGYHLFDGFICLICLFLRDDNFARRTADYYIVHDWQDKGLKKWRRTRGQNAILMEGFGEPQTEPQTSQVKGPGPLQTTGCSRKTFHTFSFALRTAHVSPELVSSAWSQWYGNRELGLITLDVV